MFAKYHNQRSRSDSIHVRTGRPESAYGEQRIIARISSSPVENSEEAIDGLQAHFLRRRLALALARLCHGAKTASALSLPREDTSADAEHCAARAFSSTIRRYSAAEQRPCAIIHVLRAIVSNEESVMSLIISGNDSAPAVVRLLGRLRAFMLAIWLAAKGLQHGHGWLRRELEDHYGCGSQMLRS